jgi:hypothetical protein
MKHVGSRTSLCTLCKMTKHIDIDPDQTAPVPLESANPPHRLDYVSFHLDGATQCQAGWLCSYTACIKRAVPGRNKQ